MAAALPPRSAIVAYVVYRHQAFPKAAVAKEVATVPPAKAARSLVALVLAPGKPAPEIVPLGSLETIDPLVRQWKREAAEGALNGRRSAAESEAVYRDAGGALRRAIWDPIAARLGEAARVFVVPDGPLNLVSFASLPTGEREYLIESGPTVHYLSAERDLVPRAGDARRGAGLLALGGPDYDSRSTSPAAAPVAPTLPATATATRSAGCASFESLHFDPLPAAEREAQDIVALWKATFAKSAGTGTFPETLYFHGAAATEAAFKGAVAGRRVLHLATHGFFLGGDCSASGPSSRGFKVVQEKAPEPRVAGYVSPLLLSGLALAGANGRASAGVTDEDGVLTAEEIAALDLSGVEWAVLSACDTGVGEIQAGEGVFGLRRAMQLAGVHTLVMSLWPVDDEATRAWMAALYRGRLEDGLDTAAAVRLAGSSVLRARRAGGQGAHPFYWAAFVAAGDWR
jgi:CHAT domain-containing protein